MRSGSVHPASVGSNDGERSRAVTAPGCRIVPGDIPRLSARGATGSPERPYSGRPRRGSIGRHTRDPPAVVSDRVDQAVMSRRAAAMVMARPRLHDEVFAGAPGCRVGVQPEGIDLGGIDSSTRLARRAGTLQEDPVASKQGAWGVFCAMTGRECARFGSRRLRALAPRRPARIGCENRATKRHRRLEPRTDRSRLPARR